MSCTDVGARSDLTCVVTYMYLIPSLGVIFVWGLGVIPGIGMRLSHIAACVDLAKTEKASRFLVAYPGLFTPTLVTCCTNTVVKSCAHE